MTAQRRGDHDSRQGVTAQCPGDHSSRQGVAAQRRGDHGSRRGEGLRRRRDHDPRRGMGAAGRGACARPSLLSARARPPRACDMVRAANGRHRASSAPGLRRRRHGALQTAPPRGVSHPPQHRPRRGDRRDVRGRSRRRKGAPLERPGRSRRFPLRRRHLLRDERAPHVRPRPRGRRGRGVRAGQPHARLDPVARLGGAPEGGAPPRARPPRAVARRGRGQPDRRRAPRPARRGPREQRGHRRAAKVTVAAVQNARRVVNYAFDKVVGAHLARERRDENTRRRP